MSGSFAPTPVRVMAIIQLCLAFSVLMWAMGQPFMGDRYVFKSRALIYDAVIGDQEQFQQLPLDQRTEILREYDQLQEWSGGSFWEKSKRAVHIALFYLPPFEQSWILFSIVISLMLLLQVEGIGLAAWLLPLIVALYAVDNRWNGEIDSTPNLFPTEQYLVETYLKQPPTGTVSEQREQLIGAWRLYLITEWVKETPSTTPDRFDSQLKKGQYAFNVARIQALPDLTPKSQIALYYQKEAPLVLILYFFWNILFAWFVNRRWE